MGKLIVHQYNTAIPLRKGKTLLSHLQEGNINITAFCGGQGSCRSCLVKVDDPGWLSPITEIERRVLERPQYRLACQAKILRDDFDIFVEIPQYPKYKILEKSKKLEIPLNPPVKRQHIHSKDMIYWNNEKIEEYQEEIYGLALDIGTTTIRMHWIDLENGNESCTYSMLNPQIRYGNNVIDRINYAKNEDQKYLEVTIRKAVNEMINHCNINPDHIYEMSVIGNSVMRDLFIGNPVESLGRAPFEPLTKNSVNIKAQDLRIKINPKSNIYALPLLSHFVGADTLAVILGTEIYKSSKLSMAVDIGTNTEIVIGNKDKMIITSCASGPAFEGSGLNCGIGAVEGAIQKVKIDQYWKVSFETIGGLPPIGICGSGLIDALAEMLDKGILDWTGKFSDGRREFVLTDDLHHIYFNGEDIDTLKLAKAAIAVGIKMVIRRYGAMIEDVEKLYLAGAFGTYLDLENARKIGLLPPIPIKKIDKVGNIALEGARQVLISIEKRKEAEGIPKKIEHVRLEMENDFQDQFMEELCFENYKK